MPFWPLDPGSGMGKNMDPDPGWTSQIIIPRAQKPFFGLKYLNSLMGIRDPGWKKFGSGISIPDPQHRRLPSGYNQKRKLTTRQSSCVRAGQSSRCRWDDSACRVEWASRPARPPQTPRHGALNTWQHCNIKLLEQQGSVDLHTINAYPDQCRVEWASSATSVVRIKECGVLS